MGRLVANLLDMMRVESGALQVQKEWQLLSDVVGARAAPHGGAVSAITRSPPAFRRTCRWSRWTRSCWSRSSSTSWRTPRGTLRPGTPIEIGAEARAEEVMVWVADRGPGLPVGEEERVFDKFHRASAAPGAGVGLGLSICRGIVNAHGGRIWAERRPGGGAVFRFTLPITGTPPTVAPQENTAVQTLEIGPD